MSDIAEKLRAWQISSTWDAPAMLDDMTKAADDIDRLREMATVKASLRWRDERDRLREALRATVNIEWPVRGDVEDLRTLVSELKDENDRLRGALERFNAEVIALTKRVDELRKAAEAENDRLREALTEVRDVLVSTSPDQRQKKVWAQQMIDYIDAMVAKKVKLPWEGK